MNRKSLLETNLTQGQNPATTVTVILQKDAKMIKKAKRDLEDQIEDAEDALQERLSSTTALDKSTIEVTFGGLQDLKAKLALYKSFEAEYLTENQE